MSVLLYIGGSVLLLAASVSMALLPRLAPGLIWFMTGGTVLSGLITVAWLMVRATANGWPRPRTGHGLILGGLVGFALGLEHHTLWSAAWSLLVLAAGLGFIFPWPRMRAREQRHEPGPVRAPLGRREGM